MDKPVLADVVKLTKYLVNEYFRGNPEPWFEALSPMSVFISPGDDMLVGADNIRRHLSQYVKKGRGTVFRDEYSSFPINKKAAIVVAQILTGKLGDDSYRISSTFSFVYQLIGKETKMIFEHASYHYFKAGQSNTDITELPMDLHTLQFVRQLLMDQPHQDRLCILSGGQTLYLDINTLIYVKGDRDKSELHCIDKVISCSKRIGEIIKELPDTFYHIHRSYVINLQYLTSVSCYEAELISNIKVPIPPRNYGKIKRELEARMNRPLKKQRSGKQNTQQI